MRVESHKVLVEENGIRRWVRQADAALAEPKQEQEVKAELKPRQGLFDDSEQDQPTESEE